MIPRQNKPVVSHLAQLQNASLAIMITGVIIPKTAKKPKHTHPFLNWEGS
jgi:hypothetical protein